MESVSFQNVHELREYLTQLVNKEIEDNGKQSLLSEIEVIFQYLSKGRFPLEVKENSIDITIGTKENSRLVKDVDEEFLNEIKEILKDKKATAFVGFKCRSIKKDKKSKNTAFGDALKDALGDTKAPNKEKHTKAKSKKSTVNLKENILHIGSLLMINTKEALDAVVISQFRKLNAKFRDIKSFKDISYSFEPKLFPIICQSTDSMDIELRVNKNEYSLFVNRFSFATIEQITNSICDIVLNKSVVVEDITDENEDVTEIDTKQLELDIETVENDTEANDENEDTIIGEVVEEVNSPE